MRIDFVGVGRPKKVAKYLKRALAARGQEIGVRTCEEIFAKMTGYTNWHELQVTTMSSRRSITRVIRRWATPKRPRVASSTCRD
jgi:hypothetical protein